MKRIIILLPLLVASCSSSSVVDTTNESSSVPTRNTVVITAPALSTTTTTIPKGISLSDISNAIEEYRDKYGKCGEWHDLAIEVGFAEEDWATLSRIIYRESRCQPDAWNGADAGLTQINQIHTKWINDMGMSHPDDMFNPKSNLHFAYLLHKGSGWKPWAYVG